MDWLNAMSLRRLGVISATLRVFTELAEGAFDGDELEPHAARRAVAVLTTRTADRLSSLCFTVSPMLMTVMSGALSHQPAAGRAYTPLS